MRLLALSALAIASTSTVDAEAANILTYTDGSYTASAAVSAARGDTYTEFFEDSVGFQAAYAGGGFDLVVVESSANIPGPEVAATISNAIADGVPVLYQYWDLDAEAGIQADMGVTVISDVFDERDHTSTGTPVDFFASIGGTLVADLSGAWNDDGDVIRPSGAGDIYCNDSTGGGSGAVTSSGIVNAWSPDNYDLTDSNGNGIPDSEDVYDAQFDYLLGGGGGVNLTFTGACPGMITIDITGLTAGNSFAAARSGSLGSFTIPSGGCAGTGLGLASPSLVGIFPTGSGSQSFMPSIGAGSCGDFVQVVDLATCGTSNVEQF